MIATLVDSYHTTREEFQMTKGYQPIDSLFYIQEGSFSATIGKDTFTVNTGDIAIFDSETPMKRHVLSPLRFLYVKFHRMPKSLFSIKSGIWSVTEERILEDLAQIETLSAFHTRASLEMRTHYLNDLLLRLATHVPSSVTAKPSEYAMPPILTAAIEFLDDHLSDGITVEAVAKHCGVSVSSLESKFRDHLDTSLYRYYQSLRMKEAKRLLTETGYTVTEISDRLGFDNLFYFCNAFKKEVGATPTEFRKNNMI